MFCSDERCDVISKFGLFVFFPFEGSSFCFFFFAILLFILSLMLMLSTRHLRGPRFSKRRGFHSLSCFLNALKGVSCLWGRDELHVFRVSFALAVSPGHVVALFFFFIAFVFSVSPSLHRLSTHKHKHTHPQSGTWALGSAIVGGEHWSRFRCGSPGSRTHSSVWVNSLAWGKVSVEQKGRKGDGPNPPSHHGRAAQMCQRKRTNPTEAEGMGGFDRDSSKG